MPTDNVLSLRRKEDRRRAVAFSAFGFTALLALAFVGTPRLFDLLIVSLLFICMAFGLQLVVGYCQLFDLGYAGFVCLGAYSTGVLLTRFHWSYFAAAALSTLLALVAGIILGVPTLRLRGDYFAIVTFGFAELVVLLMRNWTTLTGGPFGLGGIPDPVLFGARLVRYPPFGYYLLMLSMFLGLLASIWYLRQTMLGAQMLAVGDDEKLCAINGIDIVAVKVSAFALSAGIGGLIGSFWAVYFKFLSYTDFTFTLSVQVIAIVILAGNQRLRYIILAGTIIAPASEALRTWLRASGLPEASRVIFFGVILIVLTLWRLHDFSSAIRRSLARPVPWSRKMRCSDVGAAQVVEMNGIASTEAISQRLSFNPVSRININSEVLLEIRGLNVSFGGTKAIKDLDLRVRAGEIIAVIGPNGCGKTSLLNAISGLVSSKGQMILKGRDITDEPAWLRARRGINRTLQTPRSFPGLDEMENMDLVSWSIAQAPTRSIIGRILSALRAMFVQLPLVGVGVPVLRDDQTQSLRIQMRRAFAKPRTLLLLDEPLAGLPEADQCEIIARIDHHRASGGAVVVVEHNLESILCVCDRVLQLDKGQIAFEGSKAEFSLL